MKSELKVLSIGLILVGMAWGSAAVAQDADPQGGQGSLFGGAAAERLEHVGREEEARSTPVSVPGLGGAREEGLPEPTVDDVEVTPVIEGSIDRADVRASVVEEGGIEGQGGDVRQVRSRGDFGAGSASTQTPAGPQAQQRPRVDVRPAPAQLTVTPGQNTVVGIAFSHMNRFVTPFPNPEVKTTSVATIDVQGSIVYVSTNMSEPVALFVYDTADPEQAISLTMVPAEIPPVSTRITVSGYSRGAVPTPQLTRSPDAAAFEDQAPYVEMITEVMRELAYRRVPSGYGLQALPAAGVSFPNCAVTGLSIEPMQVVTGSSLVVFVARATNRSSATVEVDEEQCANDPEVRAVAAWPSSSLLPGQSVELYVATALAEEPDADAIRPSVLGE